MPTYRSKLTMLAIEYLKGSGFINGLMTTLVLLLSLIATSFILTNDNDPPTLLRCISDKT
jgi:hypothetical protein